MLISMSYIRCNFRVTDTLACNWKKWPYHHSFIALIAFLSSKCPVSSRISNPRWVLNFQNGVLKNIEFDNKLSVNEMKKYIKLKLLKVAKEFVVLALLLFNVWNLVSLFPWFQCFQNLLQLLAISLWRDSLLFPHHQLNQSLCYF